MKAFARFGITLLAASVVIETVRALPAGQGLDAPIGAVIVFLWIGWAGVIAGIPLLLVFLWCLPRALDRWPTVWPPLVGAVLSGAIWALTAGALGGLAALTRSIPPASNAGELAIGFAVFVLVGASVGFVEGLTWRTRARPRPDDARS